ncbi:MAG: hypothetical protein C4576_00135 [Desulfobacteraceae bacterium]|nr:MAG: hypothetical protein C4576_00135 [Desulfobacteraceae bacterium]
MSSEEERDWGCAVGTIKDDPELCRMCRKALEELDRALDGTPQELTQEVDIAEDAVTNLRDRLIQRFRGAADPSDAAEIKNVLDHVNTAVSLLAGVIYPSGGIQRSLVEEARKLLRDSSGPCAEKSK